MWEGGVGSGGKAVGRVWEKNSVMWTQRGPVGFEREREDEGRS